MVALALLILALLSLLEGLVAQILLVAHRLVELVQPLRHRPRLRVGLLALGGLQILQRVLQLFQRLLGRLAVAGLRRLLHLVDERLQVLLADRLRALAGGWLVPSLLVLLLLLLGELLQELVHRGTQCLRQLLDLLVGGVAVDRVAQLLLGVAQRTLGVREIAVLDLLGHRPQEVGDLDELRVALRVA